MCLWGGWRLWSTAVPPLCRWDLGTASSHHHHLGDPGVTRREHTWGTHPRSTSKSQALSPPAWDNGATGCSEKHGKSQTWLAHRGCCSSVPAPVNPRARPAPTPAPAVPPSEGTTWGSKRMGVALGSSPLSTAQHPHARARNPCSSPQLGRGQGHAEIPWEKPSPRGSPSAAKGTHRGKHWTVKPSPGTD